MSAFSHLFDESLARLIGLALLHFLWQGAVVALLLAGANVALRNRSANLRYALSGLALLLMLALPVLTFGILQQGAVKEEALSSTALLSNRESATHPPILVSKWQDSPAGDQLSGDAFLLRSNEIGSLADARKPWLESWRQDVSYSLPWLTALWFVGVLFLSLRMVGGWLYTQRVKTIGVQPVNEGWSAGLTNLCQRLKISRSVQLLESALVQVPTVIGWLRPVILLPISALTSLTPQQLETILAHELAHIRRHDYAVNLVQSLIEILLFYHPAVWWVSRQMRLERELCCDDLAVEVCGDAFTYARALTRMEELRNPAPHLAMAATGGALLQRIERLLGVVPQKPDDSSAWLAGMVAFTALSAITLAAHFTLLPAAITAAGPASPQPAVLSEEPERLVNQAKTFMTPTAKDRQADEPGLSGDADDATILAAVAPSATTAETVGQEEGKQEGKGSESGDYLSQLAELGYVNLKVDELIELKNYAVTPAFIKGLQAQGYANLSVKQLMALRSYAVTPEWIAEMKGAGLSSLSPEMLTRLRAYSVSPAYVKALRDAGYKDVTPEQVIRLAASGVRLIDTNHPDASVIHLTRPGVAVIRADSEEANRNNDLKEFQEAGLTNLSLEDLILARTHNVRPAFVKELKQLGYSNLTIEQLARARDHGVTPNFIRDLQALGYTGVTLQELIRARDHGVLPPFVREFKSAGYDNLSLEQLIRLRDHGVTGAYSNIIKSAGYESVSVEQLIRLRDHGVSAEFLQKVKTRRFKDLSVDQLIRLRDAGILD